MLVTMIVGLNLTVRGSTALTVCVSRLQISDPIREGDTDEQGQRQPCAIMRVKLHLGQQVTQRDAQKDSG